MELKLEKYGQIISDDELGKVIANQILLLLKKNDKVIINFESVISMATYNAKQIFGELYFELGSDEFFRRIQFKNVSSNLEYIIRLGIQDSIATREQEYA